jgi:hypothetical protein
MEEEVGRPWPELGCRAMKVKLSHYAMQAPRGENVYLLLILDLNARYR